MQARLILLGLVVAALMGLGLVAYHYKVEAIAARADAQSAKADLASAQAVNRVNQETIGRLQAQAANDAKLTAELADEVATANKVLRATTAEIQALRAQNENVRTYLDTPVPDALRSLYAGSTARGH